MEATELLEMLFPNGLTLAQASQYPVIKAAAKRLCDVIDGKVLVYNRIRTQEESKQITSRIAEMRNAGKEWKEISAEVKIGVGGCKKRYQEHNTLERLKEEIQVTPAVNIEVNKKVTSEAMQHCAALQESKKMGRPQNIFGCFKDVPITPTKLSKPLEAEISRLSNLGKNSRDISNELAKQNILVSWQAVRAMVANLARQNAHKSPKVEGKPPEVQSIQNDPERARVEESACIAPKSEMSLELREKIKKLVATGLTSTGISDQLYEDDGIVLSAGEISCYLYDIARGLRK